MKKLYDDMGMAQIRARAREATRFYLLAQKRTWPADKVERRAPSSYQQAPALPSRCAHCGEFFPRGSAAAGRCLACNTPT